MNVLLAAYACLPNAGTEPGHGWNWALHLAEHGTKLTVLTRADSRDQIETYTRDHSLPNLEFAYVSVPLKRLKPGSGLHYALWHWRAVRIARTLQQNRRFDLVHHVTYGSIHVPTQLWRLGLPTIFGPVGGGQVPHPKMLSYFGHARWSEQARTLLTRSLPYSPWHRRWMKKMTAVIAVNRDTVELIQGMGRPEVLQEFDIAVPASFLADGPRTFWDTPPPLRLLWIGRIIPRKALTVALDALVACRYPSTLTIVGEAPNEEAVRKSIAERRLTERVHWTGKRLPWLQVRAAYLEHDALLFTSLRETCGAQLLEAMALGLPIITLDLHGAADLVPDEAGLKVPVKTASQVVRDLAAAVNEFAELTSTEKSAMSSAGWACAKENTWHARAEWAVGLYQQILVAN